jgi:hypothetical protein
MKDFPGVAPVSAGQNLQADKIGPVVFAALRTRHGGSMRLLAWPGHCLEGSG